MFWPLASSARARMFTAKAPSAFEFDDRELIGYVVHVGFGWREDDGFGVDGAWPQFVHAAPRMVMTLVAPEPPRFCASPIVFRLTCRSPASPRICWTTSQICPTPVAPTGWPFDFSPPLVLIGNSPLMHVLPASVYGPPSPFLTKPRSSMATISAMVKQSCISAN